MIFSDFSDLPPSEDYCLPIVVRMKVEPPSLRPAAPREHISPAMEAIIKDAESVAAALRERIYRIEDPLLRASARR